MSNDRYNRNILFFGEGGQERLSASKVAVVGLGGVGSHVVQQLALLGVGQLSLIDYDEVDKTSLNRLIGIRANDPIPGTSKVKNGWRLAQETNPDVQLITISQTLTSPEAFQAIIDSDYLFGCVDNEGSRLILTELSAAYTKPYFDVASEILLEQNSYGGRVCVAWNGDGCLYCYGLIDVSEAQEDLMNPQARANRNAVYGMPPGPAGEPGPAVVSINGVVASLAVTEFMLTVSGVHTEPKRVLKYDAKRGIVTRSRDEPKPDCYYCCWIKGAGDSANVHRYIESSTRAR